jgi:hypothetical protein
MIFKQGDLVRFAPADPTDDESEAFRGQVGMITEVTYERWGTESPGDWANVLWQDGVITDTSIHDLAALDRATLMRGGKIPQEDNDEPQTSLPPVAADSARTLCPAPEP